MSPEISFRQSIWVPEVPEELSILLPAHPVFVENMSTHSEFKIAMEAVRRALIWDRQYFGGKPSRAC